MKASTLEGWGGHLVELAWELNDLGFDSTVRLPPGRRPSLEIFITPERLKRTPPRRSRVSMFTWSRRGPRGVQITAWFRNAFERLGKGATP